MPDLKQVLICDISDLPVHRPHCVETTAMGAAYLAESKTYLVNFVADGGMMRNIVTRQPARAEYPQKEE